MDATVNAEVWKKYFSLPLFESENSEHKRIHSRHDGVPHRGSNMFTVGKQRSVWTVSTAIHSANISFPISSQQKEPDAGGPSFRLQHHFGTSFWTKCLCPTVTIQWVPTAFLEAMSDDSQLHSGPKIICKGLEEKSNGKYPSSHLR